jgi:putative ABC transport system permease protein
MTTLWQDVRYGFRTLARNPGFAVVVVLILGLGIGATTSVFSIVDGVLLRALPYRDPGRLVMLFTTYAKWNLWRAPTSGMNFLDWQQQNRSFEDMAIVRTEGTTYRHEEGTDHIEGMCVSPNLFPLLGWEALVGRTFLPEETWPNHHYVVLGYDFWQRHFGGDEAILGKPVALGEGNAPYTVIGIMPPGIRALSAKANAFVDFWIPVDRDLPETALGGRGCLRWIVVGRLKPGIGVKQAQAEMDGIARRIAEEVKDPANELGVNVVSLHACLVGETRSLILLAAGAAAFVLLIACANVANLLLTRGLARRREMATRATLGAGWRRLLCQSLAESVLLSLFGGILGTVLAIGGIHVFRAIAPSDMARLEEVGVNLGTLVFSLGLVLLTGILVGLVPALRTCRPDLNEAIKADSRGATLDFGRHRLASLFVASQVSLSLILLISSGLLINSLSRLLLLDPGYRTQNILTLKLENLGPDSAGEFLQRVRSLPGVRSAALVNGLPLCGAAGGGSIHPEGRQESEIGQHSVAGRIASPGYFNLMGIALLAGRDFTERDDPGAPRVTIINESLARRFWADTDPIGKKFEFGWAGATVEIVGVVRDSKSAALDADPVLEAFVPSQQMGWRDSSLVVATGSDPVSMAGPLRAEIRASDANVVVREVRTMADIVAGTLAGRRFLAVVLSVFSFVAVVLASFGIYGVIAHSVRQRTAEIGIRMALGATSGDVLKAVLREGFKLTIVGMMVGLVGALVVTRVVSTFLYGVSPTDPMTFLCTSLLLTGVALLASLIPARRAARIDPMVALRYE